MSTWSRQGVTYPEQVAVLPTWLQELAQLVVLDGGGQVGQQAQVQGAGGFGAGEHQG